MRSQPGIQFSAQPPITEILCPAGCGEVVVRLRHDQGVYTASKRASVGTTSVTRGSCGKCGSPYKLPVTTEET